MNGSDAGRSRDSDSMVDVLYPYLYDVEHAF